MGRFHELMSLFLQRAMAAFIENKHTERDSMIFKKLLLLLFETVIIYTYI